MTLLDERPAAASGARRAMIDSQLRVSGVNEPAVLAAFARVAREDFVPAAQAASAYIDRAVPLDGGASLAAPLVHGRMLIEAMPTAGDKVLVVSASGYLAALVSAMGAGVTLVSPAALADASGSYSLILIDGAAEDVPAALSALLADDGRVVTGLVQSGVTRLAIGRKAAGALALAAVADIGMPVIAEFAAPKRWSF